MFAHHVGCQINKDVELLVEAGGTGFLSEFAGFLMLDPNFKWTVQFYRLWCSRGRVTLFIPGAQCVQKFGKCVNVWPRPKASAANGDDDDGGMLAIVDAADIDQGEPDHPDDLGDVSDHGDNDDDACDGEDYAGLIVRCLNPNHIPP
jgi:hypothetical protein